jgi:hypothetical protein
LGRVATPPSVDVPSVPSDLRVGDVLLLRGAPPARITAISLCPFTGSVYNFAVDDLHSYAIGQSQILVHNDCNFFDIDELERAAKELSASRNALVPKGATPLGKWGNRG